MIKYQKFQRMSSSSNCCLIAFCANVLVDNYSTLSVMADYVCHLVCMQAKLESTLVVIQYVLDLNQNGKKV